MAQKAVSNLWRFLRGWGVFKGRKLIGCATWTEIQQFGLVVEPIMTNVQRPLRNFLIFTKFSTQNLSINRKKISGRKNLTFKCIDMLLSKWSNARSSGYKDSFKMISRFEISSLVAILVVFTMSLVQIIVMNVSPCVNWVNPSVTQVKIGNFY